MIDSKIPEGTYDGIVLDGWCEETEKGLIVAIECDIPDQTSEEEPTVTARHAAFGEFQHLAEGVVKHLGLEWPYGLESLSTAKGRRVRVRAKNKARRDGTIDRNYYIVVNERKKASPAALASGIEKLAAKSRAEAVAGDPDIPF